MVYFPGVVDDGGRGWTGLVSYPGSHVSRPPVARHRSMLPARAGSGLVNNVGHAAPWPGTCLCATAIDETRCGRRAGDSQHVKPALVCGAGGFIGGIW